MNWRHGGTGPAALAICAVIATAGSVALPATAAHATTQAAMSRACAGAARSNPVRVTLTGVRSAYAAGGRWSTLRLRLRNGTHTVCAQLRPVLVYGARNRTLRVDAVRLESRLGGRWRPVALNAALGELAGAVGPAGGLRLQPGEATTLTVRMRLARGAPRGEWLSLAVAYAPLQNKGTTVTWPVGVTDPAYFRVVPARAAARNPAAPRGREQRPMRGYPRPKAGRGRSGAPRTVRSPAAHRPTPGAGGCSSSPASAHPSRPGPSG